MPSISIGSGLKTFGKGLGVYGLLSLGSSAYKEFKGFLPSFEEEIQVIATGNANARKWTLFLTALSVAYGQMTNRVVSVTPGFMVAVKYDMMGKQVQVTLRYKYSDALTQLAGGAGRVVGGVAGTAVGAAAGSAIPIPGASIVGGLAGNWLGQQVGDLFDSNVTQISFTDPMFEPVNENLNGALPRNMGMGIGIANSGKNYTAIYGPNDLSVKTVPGIYSSGQGSIAGPNGTDTFVEPLPPGDGKARGTFLEMLVYNTLNRPAQLVQPGTVMPGVRAQKWNAAVNATIGIPPKLQSNAVEGRPSIPMADATPTGIAAPPQVDNNNPTLLTQGSLQPGDAIGVPPVPQPQPTPPVNGIIIDKLNGLLAGYG